MENPSTLEVINLEKTFIQAGQTLRVLQDISHTFTKGHTVAITGASGSGKSTLLHILGGLDRPTSGSVLFNKQNIGSLPTRDKEKLLNTSLGFVFQFHYLINEFTVLENIMLIGLISGKKKDECAQKAHDLLQLVGLSKKADSYPHKLSGGEQQRVSILRALFNNPDFLLADEPTGNLDAKNAQHIINFFLECQQEWGLGIILCSHDR